jgi:hypothetical protein
VHGTQKAHADTGGEIENTIITFGRIQQLLAEGGVFVTGGGRINRDHSHFTTEAQLLEALRQAEANSVKRELVRQAALPPRCRMLSVCRMHACLSLSVGLSVCRMVRGSGQHVARCWLCSIDSMVPAARCTAPPEAAMRAA